MVLDSIAYFLVLAIIAIWYLLNSYYVLGTVLGAREETV